MQITGSSIGDIFNAQPYGCARRRWYKLREAPPDYPEKTSYHMERGTFGEHAAVKVFEKMTGLRTRQMPEVVDVHNYEFRGHPDRHIIARNERGPGILEVKCPSMWMWEQTKRKGTNEQYILQLQWYLMLTGWTWGVFAIMNLEKWELLEIPVLQDIELQTQMRNAASDFLRVVEYGPEPDKLDHKDKRCASCQWRKTCQGESLVAEMKEEDEKHHDLVVDVTISSIVAEYVEAKALEEEAAVIVGDVKGRLIHAIGERTAIETTGARVYYREQRGKRSTDLDLLEKSFPNAYKECVKPGKPTRPLRVFPI